MRLGPAGTGGGGGLWGRGSRGRRAYGVGGWRLPKVGRDAGQIGEAVIQHLAGQVGAHVKVTLEIEAELPEGAPDNVVRTVSENARTIKFKSAGFEDT
jgi:hypothetical protein